MPVAGTLPYGWASGVTHCPTRTLTQATAMPIIKQTLSAFLEGASMEEEKCL
jgi:hypothetical protein